MSKRRLTASERKLAIVKAALPLFARQGFAETTTKDLARAAGVSEPLLYKHFPSKEALYLEIQNFTCASTDPMAARLTALKPSTANLVRLVYYMLRAQVLGLPVSPVDWDTRHRLMLKSMLEDGEFARLLFRTRFEIYCSHLQACLSAAIKAGDVVAGPLTRGNGAYLAHHVGGWIALARLPDHRVIDYKAAPEELLKQTLWFVLRGMGMTDRALAAQCDLEALETFLNEARN